MSKVWSGIDLPTSTREASGSGEAILSEWEDFKMKNGQKPGGGDKSGFVETYKSLPLNLGSNARTAASKRRYS